MDNSGLSRRAFLHGAGVAAASAMASGLMSQAWAFVPDNPRGDRPARDAAVEVMHPRGRVPLSFIIDDSTCLVNMGHFCMPQFAAAFPQRFEYKRPWQEWPREIPDAFLREFGEWCAANGVRGKFSIVPNPACVGWLDRELPGWSKQALRDSIKLVRDVIVPNWDICPEMITHTRVIDLKTGRPIEPMNTSTMENSYPQQKKSVDELAEYIAYALQILKNCEIPCECVTTPGGFGNIQKPELALAMRQALGDVFAPEIPHYFKYIADGAESTDPMVEQVEGLGTGSPKIVVNVPAGTGDWLGGWDGDRPSFPDKYATEDASKGRMVEMIEAGKPAVMFAHWPGFYSCGNKSGFEATKRVITSINTRFRDTTIWMKTGEMARYWAAKELTTIERKDREITLNAPYACPSYTLKVKGVQGGGPPKLTHEGKPTVLEEVTELPKLKAGMWLRQKEDVVVCIDLPKGKCVLAV